MIQVERLSKTYPGSSAKAIGDVQFTVDSGTIFTLLGPSGCGKTTTLRSVAGLEKPDVGTIRMFDDVVYDSVGGVFVPPSRRNVGMVFQSYAIWPHMTVMQNVAYPLKGRGLKRAEILRRASDALSMVGLDGLEDRPAPRLSGGQQQRVALARAVACDPRIFLFDEPLSNLDAKLRHEMRGQIRALQRKLGVTSLYVTHDQLEALSISDTIAVMDGGSIIEVGAPRDIYLYPKTRFAAQFIGLTNIFPARVAGSGEGGLSLLETPFAMFAHRHGGGTVEYPGDTVLVLLRPENITISPCTGSEPFNCWKGEVVSLEFLGESLDVTVKCEECLLRVRSSAFGHYTEGTQVQLSICADHFTVIRS